MFYDILERENAFLDYKNTRLKRTKNLHFSKRLVQGCGLKFEIFLLLYFIKNVRGKCVSQYSKEKNTPN